MTRYLKWILPGVVAVVAIVLLSVGFTHVRAQDMYTTKIVAIENALNGISDSIEELTGIPAMHIEIPAGYTETAEREEPSETEAPEVEALPQDEETSEPAETEAPEAEEQNAETTATPRPTATPRATAAPRTTTAPRATTAPTAAPSGGSNAGTTTPPPTPEDTTDPANNEPENTDTGDAGDAGNSDDGGDTHVHNWVTETIPAQGHNESVTTTIVEYVTVTDELEYTDEEGGYHPPVTHQEPVYTEVTETVWVIDVLETTRTVCSICGAVQ